MFRELLKSLRMFGPRYEVSCGGYASGFFKRFYRYATAKAYYEQVKHSYPSVSLVDLATPSSLLERQSNREKFPVPPIYVNEPGRRDPGYAYDARP
jgi:hypothetical protein